MIVFVAAGFSLRCTGETPVPPKELGEKNSIGRNSVLKPFFGQRLNDATSYYRNHGGKKAGSG